MEDLKNKIKKIITNKFECLSDFGFEKQDEYPNEVYFRVYYMFSKNWHNAPEEFEEDGISFKKIYENDSSYKLSYKYNEKDNSKI